MGRHLRFYLLPADTDQLLSKLKAEHQVRVLSNTSDTSEPVELETATDHYTQIASTGIYSFGQYRLSSAFVAKPPMVYYEKLKKWHIDSEPSETIELSCCDQGPGVLSEGGLSYQKDMLSLSRDAILPKSDAFVSWAEAVFRTAKKHLQYSRELEAYIGLQAAAWQQSGGRFVSSVYWSKKRPSVPGTIQ